MSFFPLRDRVYQRVSGVGGGNLLLGDVYTNHAGFDTLPQFEYFPVVLVEQDNTGWQVICADVSGSYLRHYATIASSNNPGGRNNLPGEEEPLESGTVKDAFIDSTAAFFDNTFPVTAFGARGNGIDNDTPAIQRALDAARNTCGTVTFPAGFFPMETSVEVYRGVGVIGTYVGRPIVGLRSNAGFYGSGSIILHRMPQGQPAGGLFRLQANSYIKGFVFYDASNSGNQNYYPPKPWCITTIDPDPNSGGLGSANSITDIELYNVFRGIRAHGGRHLIERITGSPINGIQLDAAGSPAMINDINFAATFEIPGSGYERFKRASGIAIDIGYCDAGIINTAWVNSYRIGYNFKKSQYASSGFDRGFWGQCQQLGTDHCNTAISITDGGPVVISDVHVENSTGVLGAIYINMPRTWINYYNDVNINGGHLFSYDSQNINAPVINLQYGRLNIGGVSAPRVGGYLTFLQAHSGTCVMTGCNATGNFTTMIKIEPTMNELVITGNRLGPGATNAFVGSAHNQIIANNLI